MKRSFSRLHSKRGGGGGDRGVSSPTSPGRIDGIVWDAETLTATDPSWQSGVTVNGRQWFINGVANGQTAPTITVSNPSPGDRYSCAWSVTNDETGLAGSFVSNELVTLAAPVKVRDPVPVQVDPAGGVITVNYAGTFSGSYLAYTAGGVGVVGYSTTEPTYDLDQSQTTDGQSVTLSCTNRAGVAPNATQSVVHELQPPVAAGSISDQTLTEGAAEASIPLGPLFTGEVDSYVSSGSDVYVSGADLKVRSSGAVGTRQNSVRARNAAGDSAPIAFNVTVAEAGSYEPPAPIVDEQPMAPDYDVNGFLVYEFPDDANITGFTADGAVEVALLSGGGGGGDGRGTRAGGGGSGGYQIEEINVTQATSTSVVIGQGGVGGTDSARSTSGGATSAFGFSVIGGGAGGGNSDGDDGYGLDGASGGGNNRSRTGGSPGLAQHPSGNDGGLGSGVGGGGGGLGGVGRPGTEYPDTIADARDLGGPPIIEPWAGLEIGAGGGSSTAAQGSAPEQTIIASGGTGAGGDTIAPGVGADGTAGRVLIRVSKTEPISLTVDENPDGTMFRVNLGTNDTTFSVTGTAAGAPTDVRARIVDPDTDGEVVGWGEPVTPQNGSYSISVTVPAYNGRIVAEVEPVGSPSLAKRQATPYSCGVAVIAYGQSNLINFFGRTEESPGFAPGTRRINAAVTPPAVGGGAGDGAAAFAARFTEVSGHCVQFVQGGAGASTVFDLGPDGDKHTPNALSHVTGGVAAYPGCHALVWHQGESGQGEYYGDGYAAELQRVRDAIHSANGGAIPMIMSSVCGANIGADFNHRRFRETQKPGVPQSIPDQLSDAHWGGSWSDAVRSDDYHCQGLGYEQRGVREAEKLLHVLGFGPDPGRFVITGAVIESATTTLVNVSLPTGATDIQTVTLPHLTGPAPVPADDVGGFSVSVDGWTTTIAATCSRVSATQLRLTHADLGAGARKVGLDRDPRFAGAVLSIGAPAVYALEYDYDIDAA